MKAPGFWFNPPEKPGLMARLLAPLGWLYAMGTARRMRQASGYRARIPVVCVGNLNAGGTGKTPTVIWLAERLIGCHVVTRGHGGRLEGPVRVDPSVHSAADVGDEPLLLAAFCPVWVARDRAAGLRAAEAAGAGVVILDDGFQNPAVAKDLSIIIVDAAVGWGNGRCLPAGPLREPVAAGMARADLLLSIGDPGAQAAFMAGYASPVPHLTGQLVPLRMGMDWQGTRVLAFAGIGRPGKFFASLRAEGAELVRTVALDDHQPLDKALMQRLMAEAAGLGAQLVTTEKDAVRLPAAIRGAVMVLPVRLEIDNSAALDAALSNVQQRG